MSKYFFALHDLHNFWIDYKTMKSIFNPRFIKSFELRSESFNYEHKTSPETMSFQSAVDAYERIERWNRVSYPETVVENKKILENYLKLLESNRIFPILFLPPMMRDYKERFCREKLDELFSFLHDLMQKYRFALVDGWKMSNFEDRDFIDIDHMNLSGAKKFSAILNNVVMNLEREKR